MALDGKSIIVTGAARGIGRAMADGLADAGARVAYADVNEGAAKDAAAAAPGGKAIGLAVDVRERKQVRAMIDATVTAFGRLDVIFNNAGIAQVKPFLDITEDDWRQVIDINALGVLICMQEAIKTFKAQGRTGRAISGKIVNTASIAGKQGYEPLAHYSASKFAVVALTQACARAFGADGITANAIGPGVVGTDMWKLIDQGFRDHGLSRAPQEAFQQFAATAVLGRASSADDLAGVARFLASPDSDFMTGQTLLVDGGIVFG